MVILTRRITHLVGLFMYLQLCPSKSAIKQMPPESGRDQFLTQLSHKVAS